MAETILVPEYLEEATSIGAAICGGIGIGVFNDFNVVSQFNAVKSEIQPRAEYRAVHERLYTVFNREYRC